MSPARMASLARLLIDKCDGLAKASHACRVSKAVLSTYQTAGSNCYMPMDVIADLEEACGDPIVSRALFEARAWKTEAADLLSEACEAAETVSDLQRAVRLASVDGTITPNERARLQRAHAKSEEQLRQVGAVIAGGK